MAELPSREEAEAALESCEASAEIPARVVDVSQRHLLTVLALARLGFKVAYPDEETVERVCAAIDVCDADFQDMGRGDIKIIARAALASLLT
jgi:hypothetical protein